MLRIRVFRIAGLCPSSCIVNNTTFRKLGLFCLLPAYLLVLAEIISSTLKMEAICSSETSVATQQTTRRHIPEDDNLHNHRCENLKSYLGLFPSSGEGVGNTYPVGSVRKK
jgi:hypothetical protein